MKYLLIIWTLGQAPSTALFDSETGCEEAASILRSTLTNPDGPSWVDGLGGVKCERLDDRRLIRYSADGMWCERYEGSKTTTCTLTETAQ